MVSLRRRALNEPIRITSKRHGYFPKSFTWRGKRHTVEAVEQCWTVSQPRWSGEAKRHCFSLRTEKARFVVYQDLQRDKWFLERILRRN